MREWIVCKIESAYWSHSRPRWLWRLFLVLRDKMST